VTDAANWLFLLLQVFFIDLMLGADNALVIALACRRLPANDASRAVALGATGAIVLRLVMVLFADALLGVPLIKLLGAWMLVVIALNIKGRQADEQIGASPAPRSASDLISVAAAIMLADAAMSLDNVVALAAVAGGNLLLLAIGILISIPILAYGALILTHLIRRAPEILTIGVGFLGWIAGAMAASDPLVSAWIAMNAPALATFAPPLAAAFVLIAGSSPSSLRASVRTGGQAAPSRMSLSASEGAPLEANPPPGRLDPRRQTAPNRRAELAPAAEEDLVQAFALETPPASSARGRPDERIVVAGFMLLAFLAGLIIFLASFFDSLT
jgi:YjbE family integral membrane protein